MYVMLAYVLYSKDLGLIMKALDVLRDENLKFDVDLDHGYIYINEAEASKCKSCDKLLESIVIPRKCFLRTVSCMIDSEGNIQYGSFGSGTSTGTKGLLRRIKSFGNVEIMRGFIYYPQRNAFWVFGEGYFSVDRFKNDLNSGKVHFTKKTLERWEILKKLITL